MSGEAKRLISSFGRRRGRRLRTGKQALFTELLPKLGVGQWAMGDGDKTALPMAHGPLPNPLWLEIGFGGGEHLAHQAKLHPGVGFIGCEPYVNGIAGLLKEIDDHDLKNIRIFTDDARLLIAKLPDASVERVFILYPDPWPKNRHHKRRLIANPLLGELARVMKPGSLLRLATDYADYATWMFEQLLPHPHFRWTAKECADWLNPPPDWISTKYEQKALAGRPTYLEFVRN